MLNEIAKLKNKDNVSLYLKSGHAISGSVFDKDMANHRVITIADATGRVTVVDMLAIEAIRKD